jgi:hypothetical protein
MWLRPKEVLANLAFGSALFVCVWVSRVFFAGNVLAPLLPLTGLAAIAGIAMVGGALPTLPLAFGYGLMPRRNVLVSAIVVAILACAIELAISSASIAWWKFKTWWVLPLECLTVLVVFVASALVGSRSLGSVLPRTRARLGGGIFALTVLAALAWPWLYSCIRFNVCRLIP